MDERPEGAGAWGRCSSAFRAARGLACAHELPLSDFPTAELQPSPCPCLKNFLNSIPVLFLTALKPHCLYFNKALSGQVTATGLAPASNWKHMCFALKAPFSLHTFRHRHPRLHPAPEPACLAFAAISAKRNKGIMLVEIFFGRRKNGVGGMPFPLITPHPASWALLVPWAPR